MFKVNSRTFKNELCKQVVWMKNNYSDFMESSIVWLWMQLPKWISWKFLLLLKLEGINRKCVINWFFPTVALERTPECPLDSTEIKPVNPKGNQPWMFTGRADAEDEAPVLWPSDAKNEFIGKDPDAGKDWVQEEKGATKDKMVGWHHQLNGREFEKTLGDGEGQGSLACCSPWGHKESDMTEWLNKNNNYYKTAGGKIAQN